MIYKNIEIHNCRELLKNEETGLFKMCRIPLSLDDKITGNGFINCGVELRFVPIDDEIKITLKASSGSSKLIVFYGSVQAGWQNVFKTVYDTPTEIVIPKAKNPAFLSRVTKENNLPFSPDVVRVILPSSSLEIGDIKGRCRPPEKDEVPSLNFLSYGSSITHGSLALQPTSAYVARVGEALGANAYNLGFAGNAKLEKEMADYIANECEFDFATIEMGVNILKIDCEDFRNRVRYFISTIAKAHPDKKIFCIDIFYMNCDMYDVEGYNSPSVFRKIVKETVEELALPNTVYVCGLDCLDTSLGLSEDEVHPNEKGCEIIGRNLSRIIRENLLK